MQPTFSTASTSSSREVKRECGRYSEENNRRSLLFFLQILYFCVIVLFSILWFRYENTFLAQNDKIICYLLFASIFHKNKIIKLTEIANVIIRNSSFHSRQLCTNEPAIVSFFPLYFIFDKLLEFEFTVDDDSW